MYSRLFDALFPQCTYGPLTLLLTLPLFAGGATGSVPPSFPPRTPLPRAGGPNASHPFSLIRRSFVVAVVVLNISVAVSLFVWT
jgi:hypothetical protein